MGKLGRKNNLIITVLITVLFIVSQFVLYGEGWVGGKCVVDITQPSPEDHPQHTFKSYGLPFYYLYVHTEGCFDDRVTYSEWSPQALALNLVAFIVLGLVVNRLVYLYLRIRGRTT